jgi:hypothetical protein
MPTLPHTPAGNLARSLWFKQRPVDADVDVLLELIVDSEALVRVTAADALAATFRANSRWSEPGFAAIARSVLELQREQESSPVIAYQLDQLLDQMPKGPPRLRRRPPPKSPVNPYQAGLPVSKREEFFGRQDVLEQIGNLFSGPSRVKSIALYGARRSGKTSVLYRLRDGALGPSFLPVYLDMQSLAGTTLGDFLRALIDAIEAAVRERRPELVDHIGPVPDGACTAYATSLAPSGSSRFFIATCPRGFRPFARSTPSQTTCPSSSQASSAEKRRSQRGSSSCVERGF